MSDIDLSEAAANALRTAWLNGKANTTDGWALHVEAERLAVFIERAVREQAAREIESRRIKCPTHGIPDCSALLNGCSLPSTLAGFRAALAARIARGDS